MKPAFVKKKYNSFQDETKLLNQIGPVYESQSNEITNEKIEIINNLGKKILNDTCNELDKIINK